MFFNKWQTISIFCYFISADILIPNSHLTFFDVATFTGSGWKKTSDFHSMYARNLIDHLPVVQHLSQVPTKDAVLPTLLIQKWIGCASHVVKFKGKCSYGDCNFFPNAVSNDRSFIFWLFFQPKFTYVNSLFILIADVRSL